MPAASTAASRSPSIAAEEAWADSGAGDAGYDPLRIAVVIGTGIGGALTLLGQDDILEEKGPKRVSPFTIPMLMPNGPAAAVGLAIGARGGVHAPVSACASGAEAIRWGLDMLRLDRADVVLVGGAEACVHPLPMAGFAAMRAMSTRNDDPEHASRPFDAGRDGFVLAEGAPAWSSSARTPPGPAAPRSTAGSPAPAAPPTATTWSPRTPRARAPQRAIAAALRDAGLTAADIGHVNAHATSTPVGDIAEAAAILDALGDHAAVTATKSQTGHLLGAAGALESVFCLLALREQVIPGTAEHRATRRVRRRPDARHRPRRAAPATFSAARSTTPSGSAATTWHWSSPPPDPVLLLHPTWRSP